MSTRISNVRPATVGLETAGDLFNLGKNARYKAAASGQLADGVPVLRVGNLYKVPVAALERVLGINLDDYLDERGD